MSIIMMHQSIEKLAAPCIGAVKLIELARNDLFKSTRAKFIWLHLHTSPEKFYILATEKSTPMFIHKERLKGIIDGGLVVWYPSDKSKVTHGNPPSQNDRIKLIHEMGHALQWSLRRAWYLDRVDKVLLHKSSMSSDIKKLRNEIENDNIKYNETPVAKQLGQGWRVKYD